MSASLSPVAAARSRPATAVASAAPQRQQQPQQRRARKPLTPPTNRPRNSGSRIVVAEAASSSSSAPKLTNKPAWAGDDPLSRFVNVLISIKPLYAAMKAGARVVLKNSAEKAGVPWERAERALARQPVAAELEALRAALANPRVVYPDYYTQPFHAYDEGNLCWLAAREIEAATASMAIRTFRNSGDPRLADPAAAQAKLREGIHSRIREYCSGEGEERSNSSASSSSSSSSSGPLFQDILDIGCSSGISTRYLAAEFAPAKVTGLDLSPYFLALAELRERQRERSRGEGSGSGSSSSGSSSSGSGSSSGSSASAAAQAALPTPAAAGPDPPGRQRIAYIHANMEATPFPSSSFDLVSVNFVVHECRPFAIDALCKEAARLLRPGGVLAVADNNPASETLQKLPPALFALMKSTEPWSDEYYCYDLEEGMRRAGLEGVVTTEADHRHRCVLGRKKKRE